MTKTPRIPPKPARRIELLAFPAAQLLDVAGPLQVFATVNETAVKAGSPPPYDVHVVARAASMVRSSSGLALATEKLGAGKPPHTLIVAGGPGVDAAAADGALRAWLRRRAARAERVCSVCTGAFLLGAAGLLDGRRATTHWSYCAELAARFPAIRVETNPIFVRDDKFWTSAGVTAGIDLALALVEEDLGRAMALAVARYLVVFLKRPGGQAQYSALLSLQSADDRFADLNDWIGRNLSSDLSLPKLADRAGMSERSLIRHYAKATGLTPARAVEKLRVEAACNLMTNARLPLKRVAQRCGFGSEETMRRSFLRQVRVSPQEYRARFGT